MKDLEDLTEKGRQLWAEVDVLVDKIDDQECDIIKENIARCVMVMPTELSSFVKNVTRHQCIAATHVFVMMMSPEERAHMYKPYAILVQCLP